MIFKKKTFYLFSAINYLSLPAYKLPRDEKEREKQEKIFCFTHSAKMKFVKPNVSELSVSITSLSFFSPFSVFTKFGMATAGKRGGGGKAIGHVSGPHRAEKKIFFLKINLNAGNRF